jgi:putative intracellular protease/amidase
LPYIELLNNGVEITTASSKGGAMPTARSLTTPEQEQAWHSAIAASKHTEQIAAVTSTEFDAIFLPGGHGPMFDLPNNLDLQRLLREFHAEGKIHDEWWNVFPTAQRS